MPLPASSTHHQPRGGHDPFAPHERIVREPAALDPSEGGGPAPAPEAPAEVQAPPTVAPEHGPVKGARRARRPSRKKAPAPTRDEQLAAELAALGDRE